MPRRLVVLNVLLGALAVGAVAFITSEVTAPRKPAPLRARTSPEATPLPPTDTVPAAPPGAYAVVASRNLFSPTRSEAPVTAQASRQGGAAMPKPMLHGVVLRDGTPMAYLEDPTTKRIAGYRLGDSVAGGTLKAINADHVVLTRPEGAVDVRLRDPSKPRPAPTPPPVAGQPRRELPQPGMPQPGMPQPGMPQVTNPGIQPEAVPGQPVQPGEVQVPPRRMLPPNVLRRVPPPASNASE